MQRERERERDGERERWRERDEEREMARERWREKERDGKREREMERERERDRERKRERELPVPTSWPPISLPPTPDIRRADYWRPNCRRAASSRTAGHGPCAAARESPEREAQKRTFPR